MVIMMNLCKMQDDDDYDVNMANRAFRDLSIILDGRYSRSNNNLSKRISRYMEESNKNDAVQLEPNSSDESYTCLHMSSSEDHLTKELQFFIDKGL